MFHGVRVLKFYYIHSFLQNPKIGGGKALISPVLCGCEKGSLGLDEAEEVRLFSRKVLRKTIGRKRYETVLCR
jgi:hypothetical protein